MKKLFLYLFLTAAVFAMWSHGEMLFGKLLLLEEPRIHKVEKGEYLSKLAKHYYGDPQRWRELALINRAPNPNHVEVGEEILVPAANVVAELARAQTLSRVNELTHGQEQIAMRQSSPQTTIPPAASPEPALETQPTQTSPPAVTSQEPALETQPQTPTASTPTVEPLQEPYTPVEPENDFPWFGVIVTVLVLALGAAGFILYRNRQTEGYKPDEGVVEEERGFSKFRTRQDYNKYAQSQSQIKPDKEKTATKSEPVEAEKPRSPREAGLVLPGKA